MLDQKINQKGKKIIAIRPSTYDKLIELGKMGSSFDEVITEIMEKAKIIVAPDMEQI